MMWGSPWAMCADLMWQMTKWLWVCKESLDEEEINWCNTPTKELTRWLLATWRWAKKVSKKPVCSPATVLNIGQFLDEGPREGNHMSHVLAYACTLQCVGRS